MILESFLIGAESVLLAEVVPGVNVAEVVGAGAVIGAIAAGTVWGVKKLFGAH